MTYKDFLIQMRGKLTKRQLEIGKLVASGLLNKQIGYQLGIEEQSVKNHLRCVYHNSDSNGDGSHSSRIKLSENFDISSGSPNFHLVEFLTEMDWDIIEDVYNGLTNEEIAAKRGISKCTVSYHISRSHEKLELSDGNKRVQLAICYRQFISHEPD